MSKILILTLLVSLITGGTVYAADRAAPGDLLYPLDRAIENVRLDLPGSPGRAEHLQTRFSAERVQEAGELLLQEDAEDDDEPDSRFCDPISEDDPHPAGQGLADSYGVSYETIMGWFCQGIGGGKDGYGFGEIMLALESADKTGLSAEELLAQRGDLGWGEIWQELGLIGRPDEDEVGPAEDKGPPFEVPRGPKEGKGKGKGKPPDVPPGPPADRGKPDDVSPGPPFDPDDGPPIPLPGSLP